VLAYRILRWLLRTSVVAFFRHIEVVGLEHVPAEGPVLFCGNHPNSLLDPVLVTCFCGREVSFAAKDVLFRSVLLRPLLRVMGAVPVMRRQDHRDAPVSNERAFERMYATLAEGRAVGIFPEGISHDRSRLAPLRTGAARIAFGAAERHRGLAVRLVPCGLHYVTPQRFRSSVLIQFGPPIPVGPERLRDLDRDPRAAVRALTADLERGLTALTVNADDWETVRVLDGVRRLYQPPRIPLEMRVELARRFNAYYPRVRDRPEVRTLFERVRDYLDRLAAQGLSDRDLRRPLRAGEAALRFAAHVLLLTFWLPLALLGAPVHLPVALLLGITGERIAPRKDVVATTKFVAGFVLLAAAWTGVALALGWGFGWPAALAAAVGLPLSGFATLRVLARAAALRRMVLTSLRMLHLRAELDALRAEREALQREVIRAVEAHRPAELELLAGRQSAGKAPDLP